MRTMHYRGYLGTIEHSRDDGCFYGKLVLPNDLVSYEGEDKSELETAFHDAVDDYLENLKQVGRRP